MGRALLKRALDHSAVHHSAKLFGCCFAALGNSWAALDLKIAQKEVGKLFRRLVGSAPIPAICRSLVRIKNY